MPKQVAAFGTELLVHLIESVGALIKLGLNAGGILQDLIAPGYQTTNLSRRYFDHLLLVVVDLKKFPFRFATTSRSS